MNRNTYPDDISKVLVYYPQGELDLVAVQAPVAAADTRTHVILSFHFLYPSYIHTSITPGTVLLMELPTFVEGQVFGRWDGRKRTVTSNPHS